MTEKAKNILNVLKNNGVSASYGDSDEETVIAWESKDVVRDLLKDIKYNTVTGYGNGVVIIPKE